MDNYKTGARLNQDGKRLAKRVFQVQLGVWVLISVTTQVVWSKEYAIATCFGALTAIIPQRFFSLIAFVFGGANSALHSVFALQFGETVKMVLTMVMLLLFFAFSGSEPKVILLSYLIVMLPAWFGPLILKT